MSDPNRRPNNAELTRVYALSQIGFEMAAPIGLGAVCDWYFDVQPWGTITGAILGLSLGLLHMVTLINDGGEDQGPHNKP